MTIATLFPQISASTPYIILAMKSQNAIARIAMLPARHCHGSTMSTDRAEMKATGANSGCMIEEMVGRCSGYILEIGVYEAFATQARIMCTCVVDKGKSLDNGWEVSAFPFWTSMNSALYHVTF